MLPAVYPDFDRTFILVMHLRPFNQWKAEATISKLGCLHKKVIKQDDLMPQLLVYCLLFESLF
ncbi:UNVERIFIED_CONTAM: hypothetical protein FKN15_042656 [Acipenser sinensis]